MKLFETKTKEEKEEEELKDVWVNVKINFDETLRFTDQIKCWFEDKIIDSYTEENLEIPTPEELDTLTREKILNIDKEKIREFFEDFFFDKSTMIRDLMDIDYIEDSDLEIEIELDQSEDDEDEEYDEDCGEDEEDLNVIASFQMEEDCDRSASSLESITSKIKVQ